jgi:DNA-3-methyladenine glycosylase
MSFQPHDRIFFYRDTVTVARELIGSHLIRKIDNRIIVARIIETEAYLPNDEASHSFRGKTNRNAPMFAAPGTCYVYFIYGMYHCLNVATEAENIGAAVLIRGLDNIENCNGPGKLCKNLQIDRTMNGIDLTDTSSPLWIAEANEIQLPIAATPRIGISKNKEPLWRFTKVA